MYIQARGEKHAVKHSIGGTCEWNKDPPKIRLNKPVFVSIFLYVRVCINFP